MRVEQMRMDIVLPYDNPMWRTKVSTMSDEQVIAIYRRFIRDGKLPKIRKAVAMPIPQKAAYYCEICNMIYARDNPDLEECDVCGTKFKD